MYVLHAVGNEVRGVGAAQRTQNMLFQYAVITIATSIPIGFECGESPEMSSIVLPECTLPSNILMRAFRFFLHRMPANLSLRLRDKAFWCWLPVLVVLLLLPFHLNQFHKPIAAYMSNIPFCIFYWQLKTMQTPTQSNPFCFPSRPIYL